MRLLRPLRLIPLLAATALLGACVHRQAPVYEEHGTWSGQRAGIQYGVVRSVETVAARESTSGTGALIGGLVGAVVGRQFGSGGDGKAAGTALGALGGAVIGNEIEHQNHPGAVRYRLQVQLDGGEWRQFNLAAPGDWHVGDRVVVEGGQLRRY